MSVAVRIVGELFDEQSRWGIEIENYRTLLCLPPSGAVLIFNEDSDHSIELTVDAVYWCSDSSDEYSLFFKGEKGFIVFDGIEESFEELGFRVTSRLRSERSAATQPSV